MDIEGIYI